MVETKALRKHPCVECGGDAEWNAAKQCLCCPYCGTIVPWDQGKQQDEGAIVEHDLLQALAEHDGRGLQEAKKSLKCQSCHAISVFDATRMAQRCEFCGSPSIVAVEDLDQLITPQSLLPAVVSSTQVRDMLRQWYGTRWFAPSSLKKRALTDTLGGIYLPYWTFDAHVEAQWVAESGYHYYESESYTDANGQTRTRQVQKTRWKPSSGQLSHFFDDDLVPGTVGLHLELLRKVEPFPTVNDLKPYDAAYVRGWTVERYQVDLRKASQTSLEQMQRQIQRLCAKDVPGDTYRNLQVQADYQKRSFKHILVPVWLVSYDYAGKSYQVVVNAYTGSMAGERPYSWVKIAFAAIAVILLLLWLFSMFSGAVACL